MPNLDFGMEPKAYITQNVYSCMVRLAKICCLLNRYLNSECFSLRLTLVPAQNEIERPLLYGYYKIVNWRINTLMESFSVCLLLQIKVNGELGAHACRQSVYISATCPSVLPGREIDEGKQCQVIYIEYDKLLPLHWDKNVVRKYVSGNSN